MTILLYELLEKLKKENEVDIIEKLGLTTEDIVERFKDEIEDRYDELIGAVEAEEEDFNPLID